MIHIANKFYIEEKVLRYEFSRSSGPGGQNVNKVETNVLLRVDLAEINLPEFVIQKIKQTYPSKVSKNDELLVSSSKYRTQERNKDDAFNKFEEIIRITSIEPKKRKKSKPSKVAVQKRLDDKKKKSEKKSQRKFNKRNFM